MKLTVAEAASKRCQESYPASQGVSPYGTSGAAMATMTYGGSGSACYAAITAPMNCIGPQCMAWRWDDEKTLDGDHIGFCGKAGI